MKVLFVCSTNMCRSPYAEYVFRELVQNSPILSKHIESVRSGAVVNTNPRIDPRTLRCLVAEGFDENEVKKHRPTFKWGKGKARFEEADVIIGMTESHRFFTPKKYKHKFTTLSEAADGAYSKIPDPFMYTSAEKYNNAMKEIRAYLERYAARLEREFSKEECACERPL